jgi:predicted enzyme related to lactoylglutathione lyase
MFTPKGKFGWYELMTSDPNAAGKFYSDVVGWTTQQMPGGDGPPYTTFNIGNVGIAGMLTIPGHTAWIGYISVDDVDAHIEKIVEAGGNLWKPATDVPGMLRLPSCPTRRAPPLWSLPQTRTCPHRNAPIRRLPAPLAGTNSTQLTSKADSTSTTSSLAGPGSAKWIWALWVSIASSMKATTRKWAMAG